MKKSKRFIALFLTAVMLLVMLPSMSFAAESYMWPVPSSTKINQGYKSGHKALDIGGSIGINVVAVKSGTVFYVYNGCKNKHAAGSGPNCSKSTCSPNCGFYTNDSGVKACNWGYGNGVIIKHSDGSGYSMYAHMDTVTVTKGAKVSQGEKIGTLGSSGNSTGAHLHYELTTTVQQSGTYFKPTGTINCSTSAINYIYSSGSGSGSGSSGTSDTTPAASFSLPTDSSYTSKQSVGSTNAVIVNKITKKSGVSVTKMGVYLYDYKGTLIKKYTENVSNVGKSTTTYHSWYDINKEVGVTLSPGTTYKYKFFGVFNGSEIAGSTYSFKTGGTHTHSLGSTVSYESSHPHKAYKICSTCGASSYTGQTQTVSTCETCNPPVHTHSYGTTVYYESAHPHRAYVTCSCGAVSYTGATKTVSTCETCNPPVHTHSYGTTVYYESAHPHRAYVTCSCGAVSYTGATKTVSTCETCNPPVHTHSYGTTVYYESAHPHRAYVTCSCGAVSYTGVEKVMPDCTICHPEEENTETGDNLILLQIDNPYIRINDEVTLIDDLGTKPLIRNSRTLVPVRAVVEAMGGTVGWDGNTRTVYMTMNGKILYMTINNSTAWDYRGESYKLDSAPVIISNRTMLPIRFIVEYFDGTVDWDGDQRMVIIRW